MAELIHFQSKMSKKFFFPVGHFRGSVAPVDNARRNAKRNRPFPFAANQHHSSNPPAFPDFKHPKPQTVTI
jgi:hypothetical protein